MNDVFISLLILICFIGISLFVGYVSYNLTTVFFIQYPNTNCTGLVTSPLILFLCHFRKAAFHPTAGPVNFIVLMQAFRTQRNIVTILRSFQYVNELFIRYKSFALYSTRKCYKVLHLLYIGFDFYRNTTKRWRDLCKMFRYLFLGKQITLATTWGTFPFWLHCKDTHFFEYSKELRSFFYIFLHFSCKTLKNRVLQNEKSFCYLCAKNWAYLINIYIAPK